MIGHFTSADTIIPEPGKASAFDRYAYVLNNPVKYNDPSGHKDSGECAPGDDCDKKERKPYRPPEEPENPFVKPAYLMGLNESELAKLQGKQGTTNNCAPNAIATAFNIFFGSNLNGNDLGKVLDLNYTPIYRVAPNQATLPFQQENVINAISREGNLGISASMGSKEKAELVMNLRDKSVIQVVTFIWIFTEPPNLQLGTSTDNTIKKTGLPNGHTMILGAFDLNHYNNAGESTPWGFINSWGNNEGSPYENQLYWISDRDMYPNGVVLMTNMAGK